jgi:hypothetical protein
MLLQRQYLEEKNEHASYFCYTWIKELLAPSTRRLYRSGAACIAPCSQVAMGSSASHLACMIAKKPKRPKPSDSLASALAGWESEGGAPGPASELSRDKPVPLSEDEERILQCLGAGVLLQWNDLPTPIQRQIFEHAVSMGEAGQTAKLKERIARFLHKHRDDERESE